MKLILLVVFVAGFFNAETISYHVSRATAELSFEFGTISRVISAYKLP